MAEPEVKTASPSSPGPGEVKGADAADAEGDEASRRAVFDRLQAVVEQANDAVLVDVHVTGDLVIDGNNATLFESVVTGMTTIRGNRASLVGTQLGVLPVFEEELAMCLASVRPEDGISVSVCPSN